MTVLALSDKIPICLLLPLGYGFSPYRMIRTLIAFKFAISMSNDLVLLPDTMSSKLFSHKHVKMLSML